MIRYFRKRDLDIQRIRIYVNWSVDFTRPWHGVVLDSHLKLDLAFNPFEGTFTPTAAHIQPFKGLSPTYIIMNMQEVSVEIKKSHVMPGQI